MDTNPNPYAAPLAEMGEGIPWVHEQPQQIMLVYVGLSLVYFGIVFGLLGLMSFIAAAFLASRAGGGVALLLGWGGFACLFLSAVGTLVGPFFCLSVPQEARARMWLTMALVLPWIGAAGLVASLLMRMPGQSVQTIVAIVWWIGIAAFVVFLARLANFVGQPKIAKRAMPIIVGGSILLAIYLAPDMTAGLQKIIAVVLSLLIFLSFANLVNDVRKSLRRKPAAAQAQSS